MSFVRLLSLAVLGATLVATPGDASAQLPVPPDANEALANAFPGQNNYSPYAGRNFPTAVFWGDTHVHTGMSMDAGAFGARLLPDDAHRFARGEELTSSTGLQVKLSRPLDFLVVADHSDNMGFFPNLVDGNPDYLADPTGKRWYGMIQEGGQTAVQVAVEVIQGLTQGTFPEALQSLPGTPAYRDAWQVAIDAAEEYNEPGVYTAFHGYEWTSTEGGINLHRVVIMRDDGNEAEIVGLDAGLRGQNGWRHPRDRSQRKHVQRRHVPTERALHRRGHGPRVLRGARALGAALRDHADQGRR
jgi:hypothetical protein